MGVKELKTSFNRPIESDNPCDRDCPGRTSTCHCTCEKYKAWREKKDIEMQKRSAAVAGLNTLSDANIRKMWRNKTRSKGKRYQNRVGNY